MADDGSKQRTVSPLSVETGKRIKAVRERLGMSQSQVTEKLRNPDGSSVSAGYLGNIENGRTNFSVHFLVEVANALGVSPAAFFMNGDGVVADDLMLELAEERAQERFGMTLDQVRAVRRIADSVGLDADALRKAAESGLV